MTTDRDMDERIKLLQVNVAGRLSGQLLQQSGFEYRYLQADPAQPVVGLLMPPARLTWHDGALFPVMDQNLPEGDLFNRLRQQFPKQAMTAMRLLALIGDNGIGRLGYRVPGGAAPAAGVPIARQTLLRMPFTVQVFDELVRAYLATGIGVAGMQPKIMVPDRATIPIPNLIVKTAGAGYPGLTANEYLCMTAAARAGIDAAKVELSDDGQLLLVERFDLDADGQRLGFEDVASLMGLRVRDTLSRRHCAGRERSQRQGAVLAVFHGQRRRHQARRAGGKRGNPGLLGRRRAAWCRPYPRRRFCGVELRRRAQATAVVQPIGPFHFFLQPESYCPTAKRRP